MYADKITDSMKKTIDETIDRRERQEAYNIENKIKPTPLIKGLENFLTKNLMSNQNDKEESKDNNGDLEFINIGELEKKIREKRKEMENAAKELDFIMAAKFRDQISDYKKKLDELK